MKYMAHSGNKCFEGTYVSLIMEKQVVELGELMPYIFMAHSGEKLKQMRSV